MSYKIGLVFVVILVISFVHSFPNLSGNGGINQNAHLAKLMSYMQSLNVTSAKALSRTENGSDESAETDGYVDMFFTLFFDEEEDETNTDLAFGPEFNPVQFMTLLNDDIDIAYKRRCKKISGSEETYSKVKAATKELGVCLKNFVKSEEIRSAYSKLESNDDYNSLIKTVCRKRNVPIKCMENYMAVDAQCSYPSEIETDNSIRRVIKSLLDLSCANDGNDLISLIFGEGRMCLMENLNEIRTCQNKELYAIVKGFIVKLIENETFEFKMDAEDCKAFDDMQSCYVSAVANCIDPTPKNHYASIYQIIRNETECAKIAPIQTNLLN